MGTLNYTTAEINDLLADAKGIGQRSELITSDKSSLVAAINELFTSASNAKNTIAAAITGMGTDAAASDSWVSLAEKISQITNGLNRLVTNDTVITPTGTYATATYYNLAYGVKIGYCPNGDILVSMKGGTTTSYENINFTLASAPDGVTITRNSTSYDTGDPAAQLHVCVLSGITVPVSIAIDMSAYNSTYDYTTAAITVTAV